MLWNFVNSKICSVVFITILVGAISVLTTSCTGSKNASLECIADYILANIEKERIDNFIKLEGVIVWREGWGDMTSDIAEDNFMIEGCGIRQYLAQYNLSLDDLKGQMVFVYSIHSYLKHGNVNQEKIIQKVDALLL